MQTPTNNGDPAARGQQDWTDVIEQGKRELSRLKREHATTYSRVLNSQGTPSITLNPRTPRTEEKMKQVLDTWSHFRHSRPVGGAGRPPVRTQLDMTAQGAQGEVEVEGEGKGQRHGAPRGEVEEPAARHAPTSPWRRHLQLLHEAKVAARTAKEREERAMARLRKLDDRFIVSQQESQAKSAQIQQLSLMIESLNGQVTDLANGLHARDEQGELEHLALQRELESSRRQLVVGQETLVHQRKLLLDTQIELERCRIRTEEVPVQLVEAAGPSAWKRFLICVTFWACLTLLVYAYGFGGNCDCLRANPVWWRTTY